MYFSTCYLKLLCNLTIHLIGKIHIVLQAFLFSTYTLESDVTVRVEVMGIFALCLIILLLTFVVKFF